ncbi:hypothetical protein MKW92_053493 [Papaver armeniacum]|nr:hypothetical protein MKW92_053493 [Papaver armeniacum]
MTRANDISSGWSRMMRKSHVGFPEKGVATYWSFDQPHHRSIPGRQRKIKAAYQFFLYTSLGSVFMLLAIPLILWIASFASFAVKVHMVPVHIWSPEAHVEAPTAGSILNTHVSRSDTSSTPFIYTPSAIAIIYTSSTTSRQIDLKKIITYSPVAHMNLVNIVMFSPNIQGIGGSIPPMSSHGPVPPAIFYVLVFYMTDIRLDFLVATLAALGMILGAAYSLWLYNRAVSGNLKPDFLHKFSDPNGREVSIFIPFIVGVVRWVFTPKCFRTACIHPSVT